MTEDNCLCCGQPIDLNALEDELDYYNRQADYWGMESLTEKEQMLVNGTICEQCYLEG